MSVSGSTPSSSFEAAETNENMPSTLYSAIICGLSLMSSNRRCPCSCATICAIFWCTMESSLRCSETSCLNTRRSCRSCVHADDMPMMRNNSVTMTTGSPCPEAACGNTSAMKSTTFRVVATAMAPMLARSEKERMYGIAISDAMLSHGICPSRNASQFEPCRLSLTEHRYVIAWMEPTNRNMEAEAPTDQERTTRLAGSQFHAVSTEIGSTRPTKNVRSTHPSS
mmetsp:Transcript_13147/g.46009  ORF Transcript_13147/g.46009 Transcript_13147/m.46009 type:complete len:225 (-) Transcript_13147:320-994(-)